MLDLNTSDLEIIQTPLTAGTQESSDQLSQARHLDMKKINDTQIMGVSDGILNLQQQKHTYSVSQVNLDYSPIIKQITAPQSLDNSFNENNTVIQRKMTISIPGNCKREQFRNKLKSSLTLKKICEGQSDSAAFQSDSCNSGLTMQSRKVMKLTETNAEEFKRQESLYLSPFHLIFEELEVLGEGLAASVLKCVDKKTGLIKAVKKFRTDDEEKLQAAQNEFKLLKNLKHPNIVQVEEIFFDKSRSTTFTVMEYIDCQSLQDYVMERGPLKESDANEIMKQLVSGVQYLHQKNICHRDIKPDNILVKKIENSKTWLVKIVDFNVAKENVNSMMTCTGLPEWSAPEMLKREKYTNRVDLWSLGCVLFYILFGQKPFESQNHAKLHQLIIKSQYKLPDIHYASKRVIKLIKKLICVNPDQRLSADDTLGDKWFIGKKEQRQIAQMMNFPKSEQKKSKKQKRLETSSLSLGPDKQEINSPLLKMPYVLQIVKQRSKRDKAKERNSGDLDSINVSDKNSSQKISSFKMQNNEVFLNLRPLLIQSSSYKDNGHQITRRISDESPLPNTQDQETKQSISLKQITITNEADMDDDFFRIKQELALEKLQVLTLQQFNISKE